jgi:hypothetical protein
VEEGGLTLYEGLGVRPDSLRSEGRWVLLKRRWRDKYLFFKADPVEVRRVRLLGVREMGCIG